MRKGQGKERRLGTLVRTLTALTRVEGIRVGAAPISTIVVLLVAVGVVLPIVPGVGVVLALALALLAFLALAGLTFALALLSFGLAALARVHALRRPGVAFSSS